MIRFSLFTVLLLLLAFVLQQFIPAFTGLYGSRLLLVQTVFLCGALVAPLPTTLLLAFLGGLFWDAHCHLSPMGGDPTVYQPAESLRFGYSILLFAAAGFMMRGIRPLHLRGKWPLSILCIGLAMLLYLCIEYALICFARGNIIVTRDILMQILFTALFSIVAAPIILLVLHLLSLVGRPSPARVSKRVTRQA